MIFRIFIKLVVVFVSIAFLCAILLGIYLNNLAEELPDIEEIKLVQPDVPLRIYTADNKLIGEFGLEKRIPIRIQEVPEELKLALLAAEDDEFYNHPGVNVLGIVRAIIANLKGGTLQGASTITMQVARNYFLTREQTIERKAKELVLTFRLEEALTKDEILELYINKVFLGHRAYGFAAAANVYYQKNLAELELAQIAMLAGIPKFPSTGNPITNPERALIRRAYVLGRMHSLAYITDEQFEEASAQPITAQKGSALLDLNAPYIAEEARQQVAKRLDNGEEDDIKNIYRQGLNVYTTVLSDEQIAAQVAIKKGLFDYDRRHGYRGPIHKANDEWLSDRAKALEALNATPSYGGLIPAIVSDITREYATLITRNIPEITLNYSGVKWAKRARKNGSVGATPKSISSVLNVGEMVYVHPSKEGNWMLGQVPELQGALISIRPNDGAIISMVGGFDQAQSPFNRITQARRQMGSNVKPFIYSAALEHGYTAATPVSGAPITFEGVNNGEDWRPGNYGGKFYGNVSLRTAIARSLNTVSIRLVRYVGIEEIAQHLQGFGFGDEDIVKSVSISLGSNETTPLKVVGGYAAFANAGFRVTPYLIDRIENAEGEVLFQEAPLVACGNCPYIKPIKSKPASIIGADIEEIDNETEKELTEPLIKSLDPIGTAPRAISPANAYVMRGIMEQTIISGTATKAKSLGRSDLAGKTGTTNDYKDSWFSGFNDQIVTTVWAGFDQPRSMGRGESGASVALPIWIDYMKVALDNVPERAVKKPAGLVSAWVDQETGLQVEAGSEGAYVENFLAENVPSKAPSGGQANANTTTEGLF